MTDRRPTRPHTFISTTLFSGETVSVSLTAGTFGVITCILTTSFSNLPSTDQAITDLRLNGKYMLYIPNNNGTPAPGYISPIWIPMTPDDVLVATNGGDINTEVQIHVTGFVYGGAS
jgi:hypothetical protein